jgi:hypothetical protein
MTSVAESENSQATPLNAALRAGIDSISQYQSIPFVKYVKFTLALDGSVFWINAALVKPSALLNSSFINSFTPNEAATLQDDITLTAEGSLHYATDIRQTEDETIAVNHVVFTSQSEVNPFNAVSQNVMYLGSFQDIRFAFSRRNSFYFQAGIYHYEGDAVYPVMESQIIDSISDFDSINVVVSNSMPIWLLLDRFMPVYPADLVPINLQPPYATVNITNTRALQSVPMLDASMNHSQLCAETVKLIVYGLRNFNALDFQDYVFQNSLDTEDFGIMNMPVMVDEKRTQAELFVVAMKKTIEFEVNYYQSRSQELARQLIKSCIASIALGSA